MRILRHTVGFKQALGSVVCALGLILIISPSLLHAQQGGVPGKPVQIIVPYGPGGTYDIATRIFGERLSKELNVPVIIENKAGGGGLVGATAFFNTNPDGYTLLAGGGASLISAVQLSNSPAFEPRKDFISVGYIGDTPCAMSVAKNAPFKTFEEFLKYARSNPGKLRGGVANLGTEPHIMFELILKEGKIESKMVPYPATGGLVTAIMGGHLDWMTLSATATIPYHRSGDVKIVLLTRRSAELPGIPSGADVGMPEVSVNNWMAFFALSKIPKPVYDRLVAAIAAAAKEPEVAKKLGEAGFTLAYKSPAEVSKLFNEQWDMYARVLKEANIKTN
jgi:tripartite-type tricarboxylate transporter receptor subunit TctC